MSAAARRAPGGNRRKHPSEVAVRSIPAGEEDSEPSGLPPVLPPRNFAATTRLRSSIVCDGRRYDAMRSDAVTSSDGTGTLSAHSRVSRAPAPRIVSGAGAANAATPRAGPSTLAAVA
jgi:hypothetical protein